MNATDLVPAPDVLPLPAPVPLLHALLLLTFSVHVLFMNGLLGGILLASWSRLRSRSPADAHALLAGQLTKLLPVLVAGTVTAGVAPLLFLQALFGQFFFTSSVIMAWPWFLVIPLLILGYYGTYWQSYAGERSGRGRLTLMLVTALIFAAVAFLYVNNATLMLRPDRWAGLYFSAPGGTSLNLGDATVWPRWLHMVLGAAAMAGLLVAWLGHLKSRSDAVQGAFMRRHGLTAFTWLTTANILAGLWFFVALERPLRMLMMGDSGHATGVFILGIVLAVAALGLAAGAKLRSGRGSLIVLTVVAGILLLVMILLRDVVRAAYLGDLYRPAQFPLQTQIFNLALFAALLLGGLVTVIWMLRKLKQAW
jgi:hypothetical protein